MNYTPSGALPRHLAFLCLVQLLIAFEFSAINVSFPALRDAVGLTPERAPYLLFAFAVAFASMLLFGGRLCGRFGSYRVLVLGLALFAVSSALAAIADSFAVLLTARVLQGIFAAICSPAALSMITELARPDRRPGLIGLWGASGAFGFALGVVAGGAIVEIAGWRMIFWVCTGMAGLICATVPFLMTKTSHKLHRGNQPLLGSTLFALASMACVSFLAAAADHNLPAAMLGMLAAAACVSAIVFYLHQRRHPQPEFPSGFITRPNILKANIMGCAATLAGGPMVFLASDLMLSELGWSPAQVGLMFIPDALAAVAGAKLAEPFLKKWGFDVTLALSLSCISLGMGLIAATPIQSHNMSLMAIISGSVLVGFGLVLAAATTITEASRDLRHDEHGLSAGLINATQQWGIGLGSTLLVSFGLWLQIWVDISQLRLSLFCGALAGALVTLAAFVTRQTKASR